MFCPRGRRETNISVFQCDSVQEPGQLNQYTDQARNWMAEESGFDTGRG
jgi:hypothetical protein